MLRSWLWLFVACAACAGSPASASDPEPDEPAVAPEPTVKTVMDWNQAPQRGMTIEQAAASLRPATVSFALLDDPVVDATAITLRGRLENDADEAVEVVVFPTGYLNPLVVEFAPDAPVTRAPKPPGGPAAPPPRPPPPLVLQVPARGALAFERSVTLSEWIYESGTAVEVQWTFYYWNDPKPTGSFTVTLP